MIYKIEFSFIEPATGQKLNFLAIQDGSTPGEAELFFKRQYPRHEITIKEINPV